MNLNTLAKPTQRKERSISRLPPDLQPLVPEQRNPRAFGRRVAILELRGGNSSAKNLVEVLHNEILTFSSPLFDHVRDLLVRYSCHGGLKYRPSSLSDILCETEKKNEYLRKWQYRNLIAPEGSNQYCARKPKDGD